MPALIDNFSLQAKKPLDARLVFETRDEMNAYPETSLYEGCHSYCKEDKTYNCYDGTKFEPVSAGGGGANVEYDQDTEELTLNIK